MSNTRRKLPGWTFKPISLKKSFLDRIVRGLEPTPKGIVNRSGNTGIDEVWGQDAKKFAKKMRTRSLRRKNKKIEE